jgi:hypothetical protein
MNTQSATIVQLHRNDCNFLHEDDISCSDYVERVAVVGEVESAVEVGLVRAGRLRQSVLRSAFEGKLT